MLTIGKSGQITSYDENAFPAHDPKLAQGLRRKMERLGGELEALAERFAEKRQQALADPGLNEVGRARAVAALRQEFLANPVVVEARKDLSGLDNHAASLVRPSTAGQQERTPVQAIEDSELRAFLRGLDPLEVLAAYRSGDPAVVRAVDSTPTSLLLNVPQDQLAEARAARARAENPESWADSEAVRAARGQVVFALATFQKAIGGTEPTDTANQE